MPFKNTAITYTYIAWDTANNVGKTGDGGNHTISGSRDGTQFTPTDTTPTEIDSTNLKGVYSIDLSAAENNGVLLMMGGESSTGNIVIIPVSWSNEVSSNLTQIDGNATNGYNATLKLKSLDIQNSAGSAFIAKSTGSNGRGMDIAGNGTSEGVKVVAGTSGIGMQCLGGSSGGAGSGVKITGVNVNTSGLEVEGTGMGSGLRCTAGSTGNGIKASGGATSGAGIKAYALANNDAGMELVKHGTGKDLDADDLSDITTARMGVLTDWINGGRLDLLIDAILNDTAAQDTATKLRTLLTGADTPVCKDSTPATTAEIKTAIEAGGSSLAQILADSIEIQGKLPTNKFMGSSDGADDDGTLNTINTNAARLTAVRAAVLTDLINGGRLDLLIDAIKTKTDNLPTDPADDSDIDAQLATIAAYLDTEIGAIVAAVITNAAGADIAADIIALKAETATIVDDTNELQGLISSSKINAQVKGMDADVLTASALNADAVTEIWAKAMSDLAAVPAVNASVLAAINWIFVLCRNKIITNKTDGEIQVFKDDSSTKLAEAGLEGDPTTFTRGKFGTPD